MGIKLTEMRKRIIIQSASFSCMTSAEYSQSFNYIPMAKIGEKISFIKPKPLENEPSKYISKPKHNFKKR